MGIKSDFVAAERFMQRLRPDRKVRLAGICDAIQAAETRLLAQTAVHLDRCTAVCQGLCCRNIQLEAVIGVADLVYILTVAGEYRDRLASALPADPPLYAVDCFFLADGVGPCLLPDNARGEVCLTTFCSRTDAVDRDIRRVKRGFYRLGWFITMHRPLMLLDRLRRYPPPSSAAAGIPGNPYPHGR